MVTPKSGLTARRVQISGSSSRKTETNLIHYAHELIRLLTISILKEGGGLVLGVGKEPLQDNSARSSPSLVFDWTALETAAECFKHGKYSWSEILGSPLIVITSEKAVSEIPQHRLSLWRELGRSGLMNVEYIQPGARSAAMMRDRQVQLADILFILGGGTGVEHSARLFIDRRRSVIPLDLSLGASREDGTGGAERLAGEARNEVNRFINVQSEFLSVAGALYDGLSTRQGSEEATIVVGNAINLLKALALPVAFYTRLLNTAIPSYPKVEDFFRNVVDPVVESAGFCRLDLGSDSTTEAFINLAIFKNLHYAAVAIVDLTAERPNCYTELGYALGRGIKVIMTAEEGTTIPFDSQAIPCFSWRHGEKNAVRIEQFKEFWKKYVDRLPLVS